jgi:glycerophosphoryl diester phosphodiesterase
VKPYLTHEHPIRFAHRGSRVLWPQNTMAAFQGAVDLGFRYLETDVHVSADGRVVVFHDDRLQGLTDGSGLVWERSWDELRLLDAAHHFDPERDHPLRGRGLGIPLLEEVLRTFPDCLFNIDLKQERIEQALADLIAKLRAEDRILVGSFHDRRIRRFREATAGMVATSAGPRELAAVLATARLPRHCSSPADAYQVPDWLVRRAGRTLITAAHRADKQVHAWTVNDPADMHRLLNLGVDGIVTDRPDLLNRVLAERRQSGR